MSGRVYGPVPSRRLGRSLGVSPIPSKTCTYTCAYCQLGRTTELTVERRRHYPPDEILGEIGEALEVEHADYISFIGDGEPTLSIDIGYLIRECKARFEQPVAVITNGALLFDPEVRRDLMAADVVLPSLDAGSEEVWRRVNRPHRDLSYPGVLDGLREFRREFEGELYLEVMLVRGINDTDDALRDLRAAVDRIGPDRLDILVPTRPTTEAWAAPPEAWRVLLAQELLRSGKALTVEADGLFSVSEYASAREAILSVGARHPLREATAREMEARLDDGGAVDGMLSSGELARVEYGGETYVMPYFLAVGRGMSNRSKEE